MYQDTQIGNNFSIRPKEHRKKVVGSLARFYAILKIYKSKAIQFKEVI